MPKKPVKTRSASAQPPQKRGNPIANLGAYAHPKGGRSTAGAAVKSRPK